MISAKNSYDFLTNSVYIRKKEATNLIIKYKAYYTADRKFKIK